MGIENVHHKLSWTRHHFDVLNKAVTEYVDPKYINFRPNRKNDAHTEVWGNFESVLPPDTLTIISHMFGDVLQSANSCLDYLICELFIHSNPGKEAKPHHKFPLVTGHGAFNDEIGGDALFGIPFEAVAVIESLQPYERRTDPVPSRLLALRNLTNTHKHRKLHVAALTASPAPSDPASFFEENGELYVRAEDMPKPIHFKAEIGPIVMLNDGHVDMKSQFAPVVVLEESPFKGQVIVLVAERLCQAVVETCKRLDPFFS